jgi:hypothetical protein
MPDAEDRPLPAVGVYWIEEEDYPALLRIFDDGHKLPRTWKEWLKMAEEMEHGLKAYGHPVLRAACYHRSEHISGMVRGSWHKPGP